ncbi:MAG: glycosyltransferase family 2 protein, partial [Solirubrobacteraceae bacterium]
MRHADLAVVIVSTNEAKWLTQCLSTVFAHAGDASLDVVVVDNESTDGTRELVEGEFQDARVVSS